jgi:hypothetical protein
MGKSIILLSSFLFHISSLFSQVPVLKEPQAFQFENYANKSLTNNPSLPSTTQIPQINIQSSYTPPVNTQVHNPSMWMIEKYYVKPNMSPQEQVRYADEQVRLHELEKQQNQQRIAEANSALDEMHIDYELPFKELPEKQIYALAFNELEKMLNGQNPINIEKAVYVTERAYDKSLNFADFDAQLNKAASVIGLKMEQDKISQSDNLGKLMTTFKYMADTITVRTKQETTITTYPKTYDFEDFWGREDYRKMFVSKLLKEGNGQCHSMPLLFLVLCEKIGAEAYLAFAPNHSYIKFQDKKGKWHNIELTNGMLASDHFIAESGYVKAEAMQSGIYMQPLSTKQVIVQCLNDLALGYQKKYGYDAFVKECATVALSYDAKNLTARQMLANYYNELGKHIVYQYHSKGMTKYQFDQDAKAKEIMELINNANQEIEDLGFADMPAEAYEKWLNSMREEVQKQQHKNEVKVLGGMIELKK